MVGKALSPTDRALADSLGFGHALVSLQNVSAPVLEGLYSVADGLLFPSWEEGFGWPVLEAQVCGCRVFTSNRPPMTEVGGEAAVYFDPADPEQAATIVAEALRDTPPFNQAGQRNAGNFTTAAMIDGYLELYARAAHA